MPGDSLPVVLGGFAVLGRFFMRAWAGPSFADAYWLVLAMVTPSFIPLAQNTGIEIQRAKNVHCVRSVCYLIMAVLYIAVTVALVPAIGYWEPTLGYIAYVVLGNGIFMNWYYQRLSGSTWPTSGAVCCSPLARQSS